MIKNIKFKTLIFLTIITITACSMLKDKTSEITVDASQIIHTMKGGMGASWHALQKEIVQIIGRKLANVLIIG